MPKDGYSVPEKLLYSALDLDGGEGNRFTAEDLVVAAWSNFPRAFGLRGHEGDDGLPKYPDSNRVFAEIMGTKPIRKKGYLTKVGTKMYALTPSGRREAERLRVGGSEAPSAQGRATFSRSLRLKLERLMRSRAFDKVQNDSDERITFHDACVFWGITPRSSSIELEGSLADALSTIDALDTAIKSGATGLHTGSADLSESTSELLRRTHDLLLDRFKVELETIAKRRDQRRHGD